MAMSLDKTMVQRVSQLARIEIEETQLETTARELNNILELIAINLFKVEEKFEITLLFKNNAFITLLTEVLEVTLEDQNKLND